MKNLKNSALAVALLAVGSPAFADVDTNVTGAFTTLTTDLASYMGIVMPTVVAVALAFISIKWVKRFMSKAS